MAHMRVTATPGVRAWIATVALAGALAPMELAAQGQPETRTVIVGPEYVAAGSKRFWLGSGYRDLWTTPVRVPVLDLKTEASGLTPVRQVGQHQSVGLAMTGADGRSYTFRSLQKEADRMLPEQLRGSMVGALVRDMTSATHPAAGVILAPLAEAAGVPHTWPRLVVMPDDPALGVFASTFANLVGTIEEYPQPAGGRNPGFMGATEIISSTEMWTKWMEGPVNRIDSLAYLRARVLDLWVDNYDRHRGQWRWMRLPGKDAWQPLPEDPDFVLVRRDGQVARSVRSQVPQFLLFSDRFPKRLDGALLNSAEMDRWVLSGLAAADFETMARDLQSRFTDEVIERALRAMPAEWFAKSGAGTAAALRARRTDLVNYLLRVYRYYALTVDIHATDRSELVRVAASADGSVDVTVAPADRIDEIYYRRRFLESETEEVRIFLHGGDDRVERTGPGSVPITVRVVAGGGRDVVDDSQSGGTDVWRDAGTIDVQRGRGTNVRNDVWRNPVAVKDAPWIEPRSYGQWTVPAPVFGYAPDVLVYLGYGFTRTTWGFRTQPARSVQTLRGAVTTGDVAGRLEYTGNFYRPASSLGYEIRAFASGVESYNYFGMGNDSPEANDHASYKTRENVFFLSPLLRYEVGRRGEAFVGPELRYSSTPADAATIVAEQAPLGVGNFGRLALRAGVAFDSRQHGVVAPKADYTNTSLASGEEVRVNGVRLQASGYYSPEAWDVPAQHGGLDGLVAAYAGSARVHVAVRAGGQTRWGNYPWFDAAYIGGSHGRGYRSRRFTGDSSLHGTASVRGWIGDVGASFVAVRLGLVGFGDLGRVWLEGEHSKTWHPSFGGGILARPLGTPFTLYAIAAKGREGFRVYVGSGYPF